MLIILLIMIITFAVIMMANVVKPVNVNNCPSTDVTFEEATA